MERPVTVTSTLPRGSVAGIVYQTVSRSPVVVQPEGPEEPPRMPAPTEAIAPRGAPVSGSLT